MELKLKHGLHLRVMQNSDFNYTLDCGRTGKYTDDQEVNTVIANWPWHPIGEGHSTQGTYSSFSGAALGVTGGGRRRSVFQSDRWSRMGRTIRKSSR